MIQHPVKRILSSPVFIITIAFIVRIFALYYTWHVFPAPVVPGVPYGYELGQVARSIAAGRGFSSPLREIQTGSTAWFTPVYPYLLAGIFKLWGIYTDKSHVIIQIVNCACSALTIIPIYCIAQRTFRTGVAIGASWAWTLFPTAIIFPILWVWDTAMAALFLGLIFWATIEMRRVRSLRAWAGYGALWALGVLINPSVLALLPFLLGWVLWEARKGSSPWLKPAAVTLLVFAVAMVPWTVRNYLVFGKLIMLRSNFGLELWLGNNSGVAETWTPWLHPNDDPAEGEKYKRMGEIAYMAEKQHEAFDFMRTHPADTLNFMLHRFTDNWLAVSDSPKDTWSNGPFYVKAFLAMNSALSLLSLLGVLFLYRTGRPEANPYALVLLVFPLVFYLTHSSLRYRFPMDPIIMVLAVSAVTHLLTLVRLPSRKQTGTPVVSQSTD